MDTWEGNITIAEYSLRDSPSSGFSNASPGIAYMSLYTEGCWVNGQRNCTLMCKDPKLIWGNSPHFSYNVSANVANCVEYLYISTMMAKAESHSNVTISGTNLLADYGMLSASITNWAALNESTSSCLLDVCASGPCSGYQLQNYTMNGTEWTYPRYYTMCYDLTTPINPDVAGIGMLSAYLAAAVLLFLVYVALRAFTSLTKYVMSPYFLLKTRDWNLARMSAKEVQTKLATNRHRTVLLSSLVDFQKSQCIFWLAIDTAVLIALSGFAEALGSKTMAEFYVNRSAIKFIALSALVFVSFGIYCLHLAGKRSWYVLGLSHLTSIISVAAYVRARNAGVDNVVPDKNARIYTNCGPISPFTYCDTSYKYYEDVASVYWLDLRDLKLTMFISTGLIDLGLLIDMWLQKTKSVPTWYRKLSNSVAAAITRFVVELMFLLWLGFLFTDIIMLYYEGGGGLGGMNTWTFGQIIAVTIWIPVLLEWIYATTRGLEEATEHRTIEPYKLVRTDTQAKKGIAWDYNKLISSDHDNASTSDDTDIATNNITLNDLHRRRTDIEHRLSVTNASVDVSQSTPEEDMEESLRNQVASVKQNHVPGPKTAPARRDSKDVTQVSGAQFPQPSRRSIMAQRGERGSARDVS